MVMFHKVPNDEITHFTITLDELSSKHARTKWKSNMWWGEHSSKCVTKWNLNIIRQSLPALVGSHFSWEPSVPVIEAGSENRPGSSKKNPILRITSIFRIFFKNSVRRFSGSAFLTKFWTVDFQGRVSQVGSHKSLVFTLYHRQSQ